MKQVRPIPQPVVNPSHGSSPDLARRRAETPRTLPLLLLSQVAPLEDHASLRHSEAGCVSMALQGTQFIVTLAPSPHLDNAWQIVGKVMSGLQTVREMAEQPCDDETCAPHRSITIGLCGVLGGGGLEGALQVVLEMRAVQKQQQAARAAETPADAAARVCDSVKYVFIGPRYNVAFEMQIFDESDSDTTPRRSAVQEALSVSQKRKAEDAGAKAGGLGLSGGSNSGPAAKKGMWDALLGGGMGDEEDLSDDDEEGDGAAAAGKKAAKK